MRGEMTTVAARLRRLRVDISEPGGPGLGSRTLLAALAVGFVLLGGGSLDLGPGEARLGLAAGDAVGPLGRVFGGWDPGLLPGRVLPSQLWAWGEGTFPTSASVRWPEAIAAVLIGLIVARRVGRGLGPRAGVLTGLALFGSVALIDRSAAGGVDWLAGLGVVAALDRILGTRSDAVAGLWAAFALLAGGWPALVAIVLPVVVLGRPGRTLSAPLLVPPLIALIGWSAWALSAGRAEAWGAALALPLTRKPCWWLPLAALGLGLPWSPLAALAAWRPVRAGWPAPGRALVLGWLQVSGASVLAGTLIPGLAAAARMPALVGLAVTAAAVGDRFWADGQRLPVGARRAFLGLALALALIWALIVAPAGGYLAAAVSYYRPASILLIGLALGTALAAVASARARNPRGAIGALVAVAVGLKLAHAGVYVPEWNYRSSQGPWGRAIGQWVPPTWPIYTVHTWPADLAFATGHPVRQLPNEKSLGFEPTARPLFVLLHPAEFEHWPASAPALIPVRSFEDQHGGRRILARTPGAIRIRDEE
ncbi:MAG TPA: hypothetical protein VF590_08105 [Isosphaeraceae bacterium]|jgi:hypothetical protein